MSCRRRLNIIGVMTQDGPFLATVILSCVLND